MGSNLDPTIRDPRRRYEADRGTKKGWHRSNVDPVARAKWNKNAGELFGESPNLREKDGYASHIMMMIIVSVGLITILGSIRYLQFLYLGS